MIDLRSDTVTKPTSEMLKYMFDANVGDDVFESDPTVNRLQEMTARMFGHEASLYCPSGTMTNQIGIFIQSGALSDVITEANSHVYKYEVGGIAFNSRANVKLLEGSRGKLNCDQIQEAISPSDVHLTETKLVCLENTTNRGGGACYDLDELINISSFCRREGVALHLDGARLFNALVKTGIKASEIGPLFDTISICLSKGLGAPVGSLLISNKEKIKKARKVRKVMGGGMRQVGYLAAAGIYALENNIGRMEEDHNNAKEMAKMLEDYSFVESVVAPETNILIFDLEKNVAPEYFLEHLKKQDILAVPFGGQSIRFVTHLDFKAESIEIIKKALGEFK
ncbi:MAG: threonine aldolase [Bacteriovoracaceae bacterium]|nr:threonine aldolase [Bacteriovoracaceae bacterium]